MTGLNVCSLFRKVSCDQGEKFGVSLGVAASFAADLTDARDVLEAFLV